MDTLYRFSRISPSTFYCARNSGSSSRGARYDPDQEGLHHFYSPELGPYRGVIYAEIRAIEEIHVQIVQFLSPIKLMAF